MQLNYIHSFNSLLFLPTHCLHLCKDLQPLAFWVALKQLLHEPAFLLDFVSYSPTSLKTEQKYRGARKLTKTVFFCKVYLSSSSVVFDSVAQLAMFC